MKNQTPSDRTRQWRIENPEKYLALRQRENAARRRRLAANPAKYRAVANAYYHSPRGNEVRKAWYKTEKGQQELRNRTLSRYNLTTEEYDALLNEQNGVCAICSASCDTGNNLSVDHDHTTGNVRGLLCRKCNAALGLFKDDVSRVERALNYLRKWLT